MNATYDSDNGRPWWSVRARLLAVLLTLLAILAVMALKPEVLDRGLRIAGL